MNCNERKHVIENITLLRIIYSSPVNCIFSQQPLICEYCTFTCIYEDIRHITQTLTAITYMALNCLMFMVNTCVLFSNVQISRVNVKI